MMSKQEIYNKTRELVEKDITSNYMKYLEVCRQAFPNTPQEEIDEIKRAAYETYKKKEAELEDILQFAYLDLVTENPYL